MTGTGPPDVACDRSSPAGRAALLCAAVWLALPNPAAAQVADSAPGPGPVLLFAGDSMMQAVAQAAERRLAGPAQARAVSLLSIGTGLARPDVFDWNRELAHAVRQHRPDIVFLMMGANDNQPMAGNGLARYGTDAWGAEYARRVAALLDIAMADPSVTVFWIGLPPAREDSLNRHFERVNGIYRTEAEARAQARFFPADGILSIRPGRFSPFVLSPVDGLPRTVRATDGIHLNALGANLLVEQLLDQALGDPPRPPD